MALILTITIGLVAGVIGHLLMRSERERSGILLTSLIGAVGAFVAAFLGQSLGWYRAGEASGLFGAVIGAIVILAAWEMVTRRS